MTRAPHPSDAGPAARPRASRLAWAIWGLGVLAYVAAVFNRTSLGVAGIQAQHRFGATAAVLALFPVLQLAVYAGMQVPVGVLLDRVGSRRMLIAGAVAMAAGQLALATAHDVPTAVAARVLVGFGDAMTFISVLRLVALWFPPRQSPLVSQLTGIVGQLGQVLSAFPLVALLHSAGWTASYAGAAAVTVVISLLVALALRDAPPGVQPRASVASLHEVRGQIAQSWREPGTRLGLWTHFTAQFSGTVFALLWGYPFLVVGEHLSPATAGLLLTLLVLGGMVIAPVLGHLVGMWPLRRSVLTLAIVLGSAAAWAVVIAWPGRAPLALLVVLVLVLSSNGPGSLVGFDYARSYNPAARFGSASGIVNVGGFVASLVTMLLIGIVLDVTTTGGPASYTLGSFRLAFAVQYLIWAVGLAGVFRNRRLLRARLADEGVLLDPFLRAVVRRARGARGDGRYGVTVAE